jgi:peptidoglycan/xylan/chitin deacetylase (PgdA/CDA1 family)
MIWRLKKQEQEKKKPDENVQDGLHPCVAFRLDDVQDLYLNDIQMARIDKFREENAKLTIGIICNAFGEDSILLNYIKNATRKRDSSVIRVAAHGWNHEDMTKLKKEEQALLIERSNQKIFNTLGIRPSVFIPPYNLFNDDTIAALRQNKVPYLSSSLKNGLSPHKSQKSMPYYYPVTVPSSYVFLNKFWYEIGNTKIVCKIRQSVGRYGYAIVLIHPQQFVPNKAFTYKRESVKEKKLKKLKTLIQSIRGIGLDIISIEEMNQLS